eukprot:9594878-Heterocapsa_arctica.AAC.1
MGPRLEPRGGQAAGGNNDETTAPSDRPGRHAPHGSTGHRHAGACWAVSGKTTGSITAHTVLELAAELAADLPGTARARRNVQGQPA